VLIIAGALLNKMVPGLIVAVLEHHRRAADRLHYVELARLEQRFTPLGDRREDAWPRSEGGEGAPPHPLGLPVTLYLWRMLLLAASPACASPASTTRLQRPPPRGWRMRNPSPDLLRCPGDGRRDVDGRPGPGPGEDAPRPVSMLVLRAGESSKSA
jgi:hypothetical protein